MSRVIVIHGTYGNPSENWFPYLAAELAQSSKVLVPRFPTPEGQSLTAWFEVFDQEVGPLSADDVLVAHSLGAAFAVRVLERSSSKVPELSVKGTLLVSSFMSLLGNEEFDPWNESFVVGACDWSSVRSHAGVVRVYHGSNDPYVPENLGRAVADELSGDFVVIRGGGHLNTGAGFQSFPELAHMIRTILHSA